MLCPFRDVSPRRSCPDGSPHGQAGTSEDAWSGSAGQDLTPRHPAEATNIWQCTDGVLTELLIDHDVLRSARSSQGTVSVLGEAVELDDGALLGEPEVDSGDDMTDGAELVLQDRRRESEIVDDEVGQALPW